MYFYKDSESTIKMILAYVQFEKSVPKIYEFFGKNSIFRQKNDCISKTNGAIIKNSTPIVFFAILHIIPKFHQNRSKSKKKVDF